MSSYEIYGVGTNGSRRYLGLFTSGSEECTTPTRCTDLEELGCIHMEAKSDSSHALTKDGKLYCWGNNSAGALGVGSGVTADDNCQLVTAIKEPVLLVGGTGYSVLAYTANRKYYGFGSNSTYGQLGQGNLNDVFLPALVPELTGIEAKSVVGSSDTFFIVSTSGHLYIMGRWISGEKLLKATQYDLYSGELRGGVGSAKPFITDSEGAIHKCAASASSGRAAFLTKNGELFYFDSSVHKVDHSQYGSEPIVEVAIGNSALTVVTTSGKVLASPNSGGFNFNEVKLPNPALRVVSVFSGSFHTVALTSTGRVLKCNNNEKELKYIDEVPALKGKRVEKIFACYYQTYIYVAKWKPWPHKLRGNEEVLVVCQ